MQDSGDASGAMLVLAVGRLLAAVWKHACSKLLMLCISRFPVETSSCCCCCSCCCAASANDGNSNGSKLVEQASSFIHLANSIQPQAQHVLLFPACVASNTCFHRSAKSVLVGLHMELMPLHMALALTQVRTRQYTNSPQPPQYKTSAELDEQASMQSQIMPYRLKSAA